MDLNIQREKIREMSIISAVFTYGVKNLKIIFYDGMGFMRGIMYTLKKT